MKNKHISGFMPLIFTVIGFGGIGTLMIYRIVQLESGLVQVLGGAACILYVSWAIGEMRISVGELDKEEATDDRHTMEICGIVKMLLLTAAFASGEIVSIRWESIGMFVMAVGIWIRALAIRKLGKAYSHRIREIKGNLVTGGPYRFIRHPAYLGTLIVHIGLTLVFCSTFSLVALLLWYLVVVMRTKVEDNYLLKTPEYQIFAEKVRWRFFPMVW